MWFNEVKKPSTELVHTVKTTTKGFVIETNVYNVFLYKDNKLAKELVAILDSFIENTNESFELLVVPCTKSKLGWTLDFGKEMLWIKYPNKYSIHAETTEDTESLWNKLKTAATQSQPSELVMTLNSAKERHTAAKKAKE